MATGPMPLPNCFYIIPGYIWSTSSPGQISLVPLPPTMLMGSSPNIFLQPNLINYDVTPNNIIHENAQIEEEPMHKLEKEKPMVYETEQSETVGIKKEIEDVDYSDMPQLTRMDD